MSAMAISPLEESLLPYCAKCGGGKFVERMEITRCIRSDGYFFKVWCHGEYDECMLTGLQLKEARELGHGMAFTDRHLPEPQRRIEHGAE
jgi:hypothetical protein